jgi:protein gp37
MDKTKIDWADASWNPVTGCMHGCEYCYARRIAERFGGCWRLDLPPDTSWRGNVGERKLMGDYARHNDGKCHVLDEPEIECAVFDPPSGYRGKVKPYPYYFSPTFHRYRLGEPQSWKKPRNIFVCSMADLFGDWVPDEWIEQVFEACEAAPQHKYLFLTKNGKRYLELARKGIMPDADNFWYGCSVTRPDAPFFFSNKCKTFASIEPILEPFDWVPGLKHIGLPDWIIVGAETGNRKNKVMPEKDWLGGIVNGCAEHNIPLFMKESLRELMGADFRQEFPWEG